MEKNRKIEWYIPMVIILMSAFYFWGLPSVPFHPDESTQIFMSKDLKILFTDPISLAYHPNQTLSTESRYRAIDAPLTRYLIGAGRLLFDIPDLESDWNWSESWEENVNSGSLPDSDQLLISRISVSFLFTLSLLLFYFSMRRLLPSHLVLLSILLFGLHPLLLLHTRRAMAESGLLFGTTFFLWASTRDNKNAWLIGLALAIAFNAKQTALVLLPVGILSACLVPKTKDYIKTIVLQISRLLVIFILFTTLLNPFFWKNPLGAINISIQERAVLSEKQKEDHLGDSDISIRSIPRQFLAGVYNIYISEPQTEEVGNYIEDIEIQKGRYFSNPVISWGRNLIVGSILFTISLFGIVYHFRNFSKFSNTKKNSLIVILLATICLFLIILYLIPWQRYAVPILPFAVFWIISGFLPITDYLQHGRDNSSTK